MEITYLLNSGFLIKDEKTLLVFDDFEDPAEIVDKTLAEENFENLYILVSHAHFDHFGTHIRAYAKQTSRYIFSNDIKHTKRVKIFPSENITFVKKYNEWSGENIKVWTYDSTDIGVSFLVETKSGARIFHAGDFNWWHWEGDTEENKNSAKKLFFKQLKRMEDLDVDVAFFPVDGRLGDSQEMGVTEFIKTTDAKTLVAMHRVTYPRWTPSQNFFDNARDLPIWSPLNPGESRSLIEGKFIEK